ncbi:tandem-95 repeat protein [Hymenobacter taeanensis]|uniref:Tandem-95 repeat protein n=2 Tax=Hymenobacteraceae TaxID=1853232 RepID=A0A6M6BHH0_9BACT|nr:Ig-like domain-containing protein [Hymenobacter taeanensis]QJX46713.1 tandem-95 repeat protein [Hymenobacter taeanensis]UOQ80579.1 Ig-like domain-containing protein [Hymenobacter sp. 5414T-23]
MIGAPAVAWAAAPVAVNDAATVSINASSATITILTNDTRGGLQTANDATDPATVQLIGATTSGKNSIPGSNGGTFSVNSSGIVTFTMPTNPKPGTAFQTTIKYTVRDVDGGALDLEGSRTSNEATITVTVSIPPAANNVRTAAMLSSAAKTAISPLSATPATGNTIITYTLKSLPSSGKLFLNTTEITAARAFTPAEAGQLFYTPAGTTSGEFTFGYTATNNDGLESANTATYTVPVANVPPVAVNDPIRTVARNQTATISVLSNDKDSDGTIVSSTVDLDPSMVGIQQTRTVANQGTFTVNPQGIVTFVPVNNYAGISTITYTVQDNSGMASNAASVRVEVENVTTAYDDSNEVEKNTKIFGNVILNDIDPKNTGFTVTLATNPVHGALILNPDGSYNYTPNTDFIGTDSFVYRACDKTGTPQCSSATVYLNVYDPAVQCVAATGPNLLTNPSFTDGNVGFNTNYEYKEDLPNVANELVPETTYGIGPDASKYHSAFRGYGNGGSETVNNNFMLINATSSIRTLYTQTFKVLPNRYYTFLAHFNNLLPPGSNSKEPEIGFVINGRSTSGTLIIKESPDSWVNYSDVWYSGDNTTATFEIRNLTLDAGGNDIGIDDLYFGTCNAVPVANNTAARAVAMNAAATAINGMDATDPDGSIASYTLKSLPTAGTLYMNGVAAIVDKAYTPAENGQLTYMPAAGRSGNFTFTFLATDNTGSLSNVATYTIPVGNTAPLAENVTTDPAISNTAGATAINPLKATDGDGTIVKYVITSVPAATHGTLYVNGAQVSILPQDVLPSQLAQLSFDPTGTYAGNTSFTYYALDNDNNQSNTAIYTIPISNELPIAQNKSTSGMRNTWGTTPLSALEATDADGTIASYTVATLPASGSLTLNGVLVSANQTIRPEQASEMSYTPAKSATGSYNFTYYATDNLGGASNMATYTITIGGPLPVELTGFEARAVSNSAQLTWNTASELQDDRFEVERSFGGKEFTAVGTVKGNGTTASGATYRFNDTHVGALARGPVYYRLKQVDTNGEATYSAIRTVVFSQLPATISVAPNPATTEAALDLMTLPAGSYQVSVFDATGRVTYSAQHTGGQSVALPVGTWPSGMYLVVVRGAAGTLSQRLVKQ